MLLCRVVRREQLLFRDSALLPQRVELEGVELRAFLDELLMDGMGERQIHVVAAEQDVLADGETVEAQLAGFFSNGDEREVRGAAADIDHEDEISDTDELAPVRVPLNPGVEGGLRLLEQNHVAITGFLRGMQREVAGDGIEGSRNRHQHVLLIEGGVGHGGLPRVAQMLQVGA